MQNDKKKKEEKRKHLIIMTVRNCIGRKLMKHVREGKKKELDEGKQK